MLNGANALNEIIEVRVEFGEGGFKFGTRLLEFRVLGAFGEGSDPNVGGE